MIFLCIFSEIEICKPVMQRIHVHNFNLYSIFNIFTDDFVLYHLLNMFCQFDHDALVPGNGTQILVYEYTVQFLQACWCFIDVFQTFSIDEDFFACFVLTNRIF